MEYVQSGREILPVSVPESSLCCRDWRRGVILVGGVHFYGRFVCICVCVCTVLATAVEICFPSRCTCEQERFVQKVAPATYHNRGTYINNK